jgi:hypothetical protein
VAQDVGTEFKSQYHKKQQQKFHRSTHQEKKILCI